MVMEGSVADLKNDSVWGLDLPISGVVLYDRLVFRNTGLLLCTNAECSLIFSTCKEVLCMLK